MAPQGRTPHTSDQRVLKGVRRMHIELLQSSMRLDGDYVKSARARSVTVR